MADRPGERAAERTAGIAVDEHPCRAVEHHCRPAGDGFGNGVDRAAEVLRDECPQLDREQLAAAVRHGACGGPDQSSAGVAGAFLREP